MPQPKDKDWLNGYKNKTPIHAVYKRLTLKQRDTYRLKVKGWKKIFHANKDQKKAGVAILISDKIDFKTKAVKRDKEGHYIMATHSNSLAWKIPWTKEPGRLQSMGSQSRTQ